MSPIPIRVTPAEIHVHADRRLTFQVLTAFGASAQHPGGASSKVVERAEDGKRLLVEFHTPATGPFGRPTVYRTLEWVTLHEPEAIDFDGQGGPFSLLRDRFTLKEEAGCTRFRYESTFALKGGIFGWLLGVLYVRRKLGKFMRTHMTEMKETIEERAKRSNVFPQLPCAWELETIQHDAMA